MISRRNSLRRVWLGWGRYIYGFHFSRERSRVRVSSSSPFFLKELSDVTPKTPTHNPTQINPPQALAFVYRTASFAVVFTTHHDSAHQVFTRVL
jgi:hypothetical protein